MVKIYSSYLDETDAFNDHLTRTNKASQQTKLYEQWLEEKTKEQQELMKSIGADYFEDHEYNKRLLNVSSAP